MLPSRPSTPRSHPCQPRRDPSHPLKRRMKSVKFVPNVSIRHFFHEGRGEGAADLEAIEANKERLRALCRLHRSKNRRGVATYGDVTRYEILGESLRGAEHLTTRMTKRRRTKTESVRAVMVEQREQLVKNVLNLPPCLVSSHATVEDATVKREAMKMDHERIAAVYRAKSRAAQFYARRIAHEDAMVAAEILAEDSPPSALAVRPSIECDKKRASELAAHSAVPRKDFWMSSTSHSEGLTIKVENK